MSGSVGSQLGKPERGPASRPDHHRSPTSPASSRTGSSTFSYPTASPSLLSNQLSTSSSSQGSAHVRWNSAAELSGCQWRPVEVSGETSDAGLDPTQMYYVTSYSTTELRTFLCECTCKMPLSRLNQSMLKGFLCKKEMDWIDLRRRVAGISMLCHRSLRRSSRLVVTSAKNRKRKEPRAHVPFPSSVAERG
jgi:cysteine protease ATG4